MEPGSKAGLAASIRYMRRLMTLYDLGADYEEMKKDKQLIKAYKAWMRKLQK